MNNSSEVKASATTSADGKAIKTNNGSAVKKGKTARGIRLVTKAKRRYRQPDGLITRMGREAVPTDPSWRELAAVIVERALLEDHADRIRPDKAKKMRASERAVRLKIQEHYLWQSCCIECADYLRRPKLIGKSRLRLREVLTDLTSAFIKELRRGYWG
jgi:hypothetical protein